MRSDSLGDVRSDIISGEHKSRLKQSWDELASSSLERLDALAIEEPPTTKKDLFGLLEKFHARDRLLTQLWSALHTVPEWVDWEQIARGQNFFYRHAYPYILGFAFQGVLGENLAVRSVGEVLVRTGGFSAKAIIPRLFESFQWVLEITDNPESIRPGGAGHMSTARIRLLHARVRQRILKLAQEKDSSNNDYFDPVKMGIPANDLDSIHTITTFCANPMYIWLPRQGIVPTEQEIGDFNALFRYIAYLLGTPTANVETPAKSKATMLSLQVEGLDYDEQFHLLGTNFIHAFVDWAPLYLSREWVGAACWWINGPKISKSLGMRKPGVFHYGLMVSSCLLAMTISYLAQKSSAFDSWIQKTARQRLRYYIIECKYVLKQRSIFDFKYVPRVGKIMGKVPATKSDASVPFSSRLIEFYLAIWTGVFMLVLGGVIAVLYMMFWQ